MPHHVRTVGLHECELNCAMASWPRAGSKNSFRNRDASAVVIGDAPQVPALSFREGKKGLPVISLISFNAFTNDSPQASSESNVPSAVNGSNLVLSSLLFDVLCFEDSASTKTNSSCLSTQICSSLAKSDQRADAKTQNNSAPDTAVRNKLVLLVQMISSVFTAATVSWGACLSFRFSKYIEWAAPWTRGDKIVLQLVFVNLRFASKKFKASTTWLARVGAASCSLSEHIYEYSCCSVTLQIGVCSFSSIHPASDQRDVVLLRIVAVAFFAKQSLRIWSTSTESSNPPAKLHKATPISVPCRSSKSKLLIWFKHRLSNSSSGITHFDAAMRLTANFEAGPVGIGESCLVNAAGANVSMSPTTGGVKPLTGGIAGIGPPKMGARGPCSHGILMSWVRNLCIASRLASLATFCNCIGLTSWLPELDFVAVSSWVFCLFTVGIIQGALPVEGVCCWESDSPPPNIDMSSRLAWDLALHLALKPLAAEISCPVMSP